MKIFIYALLLSSIAFGANEYKQPNDAIFYKTLKIPLLTPAGIATNTSGGQLGTVSKVPIANGGTNSSNSLLNSRVIVSSGGTIGESSTTTTQLGFLDATSSIQTQLNSKQSTLITNAIDATPNANGYIIGAGSTLALEPASSSFGGVVTTGTQTLAGAKTFSTSVSTPALNDNGSGLNVLTAANQNLLLQTSGSGRMKLNGSEGLDVPEVSTPTRAAVNYDSLYFKSDHNLYTEANTALSTEFRFGLRDAGNFNNNRVIVSSGDTLAELSSGGVSGQILTSAGASSPTWSTNAPVATNITGILPVANGGTNTGNTLLNNRVIVSSGGTVGEFLPGTSGQILTSAGSGSSPTWSTNAPAASNITGTLAIFHGGTNSSNTLLNNRFIVSSGGTIGEHTPVTANSLVGTDANGLPKTIAIPLSIANGGTNSSNVLLNNRVVVSSGGTIGEFTPGTSGQILTSAGSGSSPTWSTNAPVATNITGILAVANGGTNTGNTLLNNRVMVSNGGTVGEFTPGASGQFLQSQGSGSAPIWAAALSNPMTTTGDMIYSTPGSTPVRLAIGLGASVLTVTSGLPTWKAAAAAALNSFAFAYSPSGHGATGTSVRTFTTEATTGSDITYASDGTNGDKFTINTAGTYTISYVDGGTSSNFGVSKNASSNITSIATLTHANGKIADVGVTSALGRNSIAITIPLAVNDVIRAHDDGTCSCSAEDCVFIITRVN